MMNDGKPRKSRKSRKNFTRRHEQICFSPAGALQDFEYFGFLFEALCARDVRVYAQSNDGDVFHYRDKSGLEADMIVQLHDGRWGAIEVKLGNTQIEQAAENLLKLKEKTLSKLFPWLQ